MRRRHRIHDEQAVLRPGQRTDCWLWNIGLCPGLTNETAHLRPAQIADLPGRNRHESDHIPLRSLRTASFPN